MQYPLGLGFIIYESRARLMRVAWIFLEMLSETSALFCELTFPDFNIRDIYVCIACVQKFLHWE